MVIFGDFDIATQKDDKDLKNYGTILAAFAFQLRKFESIRETTNSKSINHIVTPNEKVTIANTTNSRDDSTVLTKIPVLVNYSEITENLLITRKSNSLKGE